MIVIYFREISLFQALGRVEKTVLEWQFDEKHQLTFSTADGFKVVSDTIDYVLDAGRSLGGFLRFLGSVNPTVAEVCISQNVLSRFVFLNAKQVAREL